MVARAWPPGRPLRDSFTSSGALLRLPYEFPSGNSGETRSFAPAAGVAFVQKAG